MRGPEDLVEVVVTLRARISLDRERIIDDPVWATIADNYDLTKPRELQDAMFKYLNSYLQRQQLFGGQSVFMPSTNGPADITLVEMESRLEEGNNGNSTGNASDAGCAKR